MRGVSERRHDPLRQLGMAYMVALLVGLGATAHAANGSGTPADQQWAKAARTLRMPLLVPRKLHGLRFARLTTTRTACLRNTRQVHATYQKSSAYLMIFEARPAACGQLGDMGKPKHLRIRGHGATLWTGSGTSALTWREGGTQIMLIAGHVSRRELTAIANSMVLRRP